MREWEWKKNKKRMEEKYKLFKEMIMKEKVIYLIFWIY